MSRGIWPGVWCPTRACPRGLGGRTPARAWGLWRRGRGLAEPRSNHTFGRPIPRPLRLVLLWFPWPSSRPDRTSGVGTSLDRPPRPSSLLAQGHSPSIQAMNEMPAAQRHPGRKGLVQNEPPRDLLPTQCLDFGPQKEQSGPSRRPALVSNSWQECTTSPSKGASWHRSLRASRP